MCLSRIYFVILQQVSAYRRDTTLAKYKILWVQSAGAILVEEQTALMLLVYIWEPDKFKDINTTGRQVNAYAIA